MPGSNSEMFSGKWGPDPVLLLPKKMDARCGAHDARGELIEFMGLVGSIELEDGRKGKCPKFEATQVEKWCRANG